MKRGVALTSAFLLLGLAACNQDENLGRALGTDALTGPPATIPDNPDPGTPPGTGGPTPDLGATCHSTDPNKICLSLKYVVYKNSAGTPVIPDSTVLSNLVTMNSIWSQCNIAFEIGDYAPVNPVDYGLNYNTSSSSEMTSARRAFLANDTLLVVTTGTWAGSLGSGSANAWTTMPGGGTYGVVLEAPVADYPNIIAHELGHYLNLDHASDSANVMSAIIYEGSTRLTTTQCNAARSAAAYYWKAMYR